MREIITANFDTRVKTIAKTIENIERKTRWEIRRFESKSDHKTQLKADAEKEKIELYTEKEAIQLFGAPNTHLSKETLP
jgi:hypothetical protein